MKNTIFCFLTCSFLLLLGSCGAGSSSIDNNGAFPKEPDTPQGVQFSYLMYEDDFNAVPQDGNHVEYGTKFRPSDGSGMSFELTNARQYAPGLIAQIGTVKKGEWYKISFNCFKETAPDPADVKGMVVISITRSDTFFHYKAYSFNELLKEQNKNLIGKWTNLTIWHQAPENLQANDRLQIYHWNPDGGSVFLDDFVVEAWTTETNTPTGISLSHGLLEQNYETPDLASMTTKETAARGMASCVLSNTGAQFGAGFQGALEESQIKPGDYIKVSFSALKKHKTINYSNASLLVFEIKRDQKDVVLWQGTPIEPSLHKDGKQVLNEWSNVVVWKQIPADAQPSDILSVYPWNPQTNPIYVDDVRVEVWRTNG